MSQQESQKTPLVLPIDAPRVHSFLTNLNPTFGELDYDKDLHMKYLVMDWPSNDQYVIMTKEQLELNFDASTVRTPWFFSPFLVEPR